MIAQIESGDVSGSQPSRFNRQARAAYDAHAKLLGMSVDDAMNEFVKTMTAFDSVWVEKHLKLSKLRACLEEHSNSIVPHNLDDIIAETGFNGNWIADKG